MPSSCSRVAVLLLRRRNNDGRLYQRLVQQRRFLAISSSGSNHSLGPESCRSLSSTSGGGGGKDRRFGWKGNKNSHPSGSQQQQQQQQSHRPLRKDQAALRKHKGHRVKSRGLGGWEEDSTTTTTRPLKNHRMAATSPGEVFGTTATDEDMDDPDHEDDNYYGSQRQAFSTDLKSLEDYEQELQKKLLYHNSTSILSSRKSFARLLDTNYSFPELQADRMSFAQVLSSNDDSTGHHYGRHPHAFHQTNGLDYHYWNESDFDFLLPPSSDDDEAAFFQPDEDGDVFMERNEEDGMVTIYYDDQEHNRAFFTNYDDDEIFDVDANAGQQQQQQQQQQQRTQDTRPNAAAPLTLYDPEQEYFYQGVDLFQILAEKDGSKTNERNSTQDMVGSSSDGRWYDSIAPLKNHGPNIDDFLSAMQEHPTKYAQVKRQAQHPDSLRQPKPDIPPHRTNPSSEFVTSYPRFLYVFGLPSDSSTSNPKEETPVLDTLAQQSMQKNLTRYFSDHCGISLLATQIAPANATSAFIGFSSEEDLEVFLHANNIGGAVGEEGNGQEQQDQAGFRKALELSLFDKNQAEMETKQDLSSFLEGQPEGSVLQLDCIPPGQSRESLCRNLFPMVGKNNNNSEEDQLAQLYRMEPQDVIFLGRQTALIKYASSEKAKAALESTYVQECLERMGVYPVRMLRARRDLVFVGWGGPAKQQPIREMGTKLIVDGDMPSKAFYLSHANTLLLRNLNPENMRRMVDEMKLAISQVFQPFAAVSRDVEGSIEIPTCFNGIPLGKAYVGFDRVGEMDKAFEVLKGGVKIEGNDNMVVIMKKTKDRPLPRKTASSEHYDQHRQRAERSIDELLDDLNHWEKHVDPADVAYLQQNGISKQVLDEALRGIRYHNVTFGALDQAKGEETFVSSKARGEDYRELVQEYIATLKECVATPENPGLYFDAMHMPGEEWDLSYFDREKKRQKKFTQRRQSGPSIP